MKYDEKNEVYRGSARSIESIPLNQIFDDLKIILYNMVDML